MIDFIAGVGKFIWVIFQVIVLFNLLIVVHELGHYWAAKWRGLKVEKFQIWFGKPIWKKEVNGVQWGLGTIPMGGFVALPQMAPMDMIEGGTDGKEKLPPITPLDKIIVAFAGPLFSFGLAFAFALLVWGLGKPVRDSHQTTVVGAVLTGSPAEEAGILPGDKILEVNDSPVRDFVGMVDSVIERIIYSKGEKIKLLIQRPGEDAPREVYSGFEKEERPAYERQDFRKIGVRPETRVKVGSVFANSPAAEAGLAAGDIVVRIGGEKVFHPDSVGRAVREAGETAIEVVVLRGGEELTFSVTPRKPKSPAGSSPMLGVGWDLGADMRIERPGPNPFRQVWDGGTAIFRTIGALFASDDDVNVTQMSSAVGIGNYYYQTLSDPVYGWRLAFVLSVLINVNLGLLNLLPFPVLDGGHIMMASYEAVRKRPLNMRAMEIFQATCALLLIGFMLFVTWFDVGDIVKKSGSEKPEEGEKAEQVIFEPAS